MGQLPTNGNARNPERNPPLEYFKGNERTNDLRGGCTLFSSTGPLSFSLSLCPEISLTRLSLISYNGTTSDFCFLFPFFRKGLKEDRAIRKVGEKLAKREERGES